MYNSTTIVGNLGRDPEARYMSSGDMVTSFSVATSKKWTGKDGKENEHTTWFRVSVFGKQAEACNTYLKKGSKALVVGTLQSDPATGNPKIFDKSDGSKGTSYELRADTVKFLSSRSESESSAGEAVDEREIPF